MSLYPRVNNNNNNNRLMALLCCRVLRGGAASHLEDVRLGDEDADRFTADFERQRRALATVDFLRETGSAPLTVQSETRHLFDFHVNAVLSPQRTKTRTKTRQRRPEGRRQPIRSLLCLLVSLQVFSS